MYDINDYSNNGLEILKYSDKILKPYKECEYNIADAEIHNGVIRYNKANNTFHLEGEIQLVQLLAISICKYATKSNTYREKIILGEVDLKPTLELFHSKIVEYTMKLHLHGDFNPFYDRFEFNTGKCGRLWVRADEEEVDLDLLIGLLVRLAIYVGVDVWQELNDDMNIVYYVE